MYFTVYVYNLIVIDVREKIDRKYRYTCKSKMAIIAFNLGFSIARKKCSTATVLFFYRFSITFQHFLLCFEDFPPDNYCEIFFNAKITLYSSRIGDSRND